MQRPRNAVGRATAAPDRESGAAARGVDPWHGEIQRHSRPEGAAKSSRGGDLAARFLAILQHFRHKAPLVSHHFCGGFHRISRGICDFSEKIPGFLGCIFVLVYF
jgi:hypothetical protein